MTTTVFAVTNFSLAATPPGYFVPNASGAAVPAGHTSWYVIVDTTGLQTGQPLASVVTQYHYTNAQLGASGQPNQGQVTNTDGTVTQITGGTFTGWIDDTSSPLNTTVTNRSGQTVHQAAFGADLNRIPGYYPDTVRLLITSSPGYAAVPSATLSLN